MAKSIPSYYVDGYALYAILQGKPGFKEFAKKVSLITASLDLQVLHGLVLKRYGERTAETIYEEFSPYVVSIPPEVYKEANAVSTKGLPATEMIGWLTARSRNIPFLTADPRFRGKQGVILR